MQNVNISFPYIDRDEYDRMRCRTIQVLYLTQTHVWYQVHMPGIAHNASPARVRIETFRGFFSRSMPLTVHAELTMLMTEERLNAA